MSGQIGQRLGGRGQGGSYNLSSSHRPPCSLLMARIAPKPAVIQGRELLPYQIVANPCISKPFIQTMRTRGRGKDISCPKQSKTTTIAFHSFLLLVVSFLFLPVQFPSSSIALVVGRPFFHSGLCENQVPCCTLKINKSKVIS